MMLMLKSEVDQLPASFLPILEFGGKTLLTLETRGTAVVDNAAAYLKGMEQGWTQSLEHVAEFTAKT